MPGGGAITLATANATAGRPERPEHPPAGEYVMVSVADTGCGIPPEIIDKVFNPFFTTKEVGKGSGLGLSLVLGVAQQLGGGVRIETQPGVGTTVKVYLPRAGVAEARSLARRATWDAGRGRPARDGAAAGFCWSTTIPMSARSPPRCSPRPAMTWSRPAAAARRSICSKTRISGSN